MTPQEFLTILSRAAILKTTTRHCYTQENRKESVADHSWRIALMAMLFHFVPQNSTHAALTIAGGFAVVAAAISFARISLPLPEGLARKTRKSK